MKLHIDDQKMLAKAILANKVCLSPQTMTRWRKYAEEYSKRVERK